ncbi:hypothetical protein FIBSPDRAFT_873098 [Athelia psychrophila]|uniref:F-box domain-containing protein n=1 Tax=Athelia psychrophila TaxID=1759441 RepID=A0A165YVU8_9AGAM|nr:hypothetical protein FIBSPDRAFT_873098 [Fibularhizoctonia sp. CBS 109695]
MDSPVLEFDVADTLDSSLLNQTIMRAVTPPNASNSISLFTSLSALAITQDPPHHSTHDPAQIDHSRRVPPEILCEVFLHCVPHDRPVDYREYITQVLRLTHVSLQWRCLGIATAHLWTHLKFLSYSAGEMEIAQACLFRSRSLPITISMKGVDIYMPTEHAAYQKALEVLVANCARWRDATFLSSLAATEITSLITNNIPMLERLSIIDLESYPDIFGVAPKFRSLSIRSVGDGLGCSIPWGQLTDLTIGSTHANSVSEVLQQIPNIVTLKMGPVLGGPDHVHFPDIRLALLENLDITNKVIFGPPLDPFVDRLTFPSLVHFRHGGEGKCGHLTLASLLGRSSTTSPLTSLSLNIRLCGGVQDRLSQILAATPHVVDLEFTGIFDNNNPTGGESVIKTLTVTDGNCLLPKLQSLTYHPRYTVGSGIALAEMIESRRKGGRPDVKVVVSLLPQVEPMNLGLDPKGVPLSAQALADLRQFVAEGLLVVRGLPAGDLVHS